MSINHVHGALATYQYTVKAQKTSAKEITFDDKVTEAGSTQELSDAEKLGSFKKEIWNEINSYPWNPSISESIQITDGAFQRMMEDSDFKDRMLDVLYRDAVAGRPPICAGITRIDESGYSGYSYNDKQAGEIAFQVHSNHKDSFYVHKATKGQDYAELWEEKRMESERQREKLDKEYVEKLYFDRSLLRKEQAFAAYEAIIITDPIESSGFNSATTETKV